MKKEGMMGIAAALVMFATGIAAEIEAPPQKEPIIISETTSQQMVTHMVYLYSTLSYDDLQKALSPGQTLWIYYFLNDYNLMAAKYSNLPFIITVKLTKESKTFYVYFSKNGWMSFPDFTELKNSIQTLIDDKELEGKDPNFDLIKDYVDWYEDGIRAGGLYHIASIGEDFVLLPPQQISSGTGTNTSEGNTTESETVGENTTASETVFSEESEENVTTENETQTAGSAEEPTSSGEQEEQEQIVIAEVTKTGDVTGTGGGTVGFKAKVTLPEGVSCEDCTYYWDLDNNGYVDGKIKSDTVTAFFGENALTGTAVVYVVNNGSGKCVAEGEIEYDLSGDALGATPPMALDLVQLNESSTELVPCGQ